MKRTTEITDWDKGKLLLNEDREEIVDRCRSEALSIQDLSRVMHLNPGSVHNHVHKLLAAGFLEVESTREINGITERKYRRTGAFFSLFYVQEDQVEARNKALQRMAQKRMARCLELGPKPAGLFAINARVSAEKLAQLGQMMEDLRLALLAADGSGELPISSVAVLGEVPPRRKKT